MGVVREIFDEIRKLRFYNIVYQYEQGLYFKNGKKIERRVKLWGGKLEEVVAEEKKVIKDNGGHFKVMLPYISCGLVGKNPNFPEGYRKGILTGLPKHPKRFKKDEVLEPGLYFHIPIIEEIVTDYSEARTLDFGTLDVLTTDEDTKVITFGCSINCKLSRFNKAYCDVYDYKSSLREQTLTTVAEYSRGKTLAQWKNPEEVMKIAEESTEALKKIATKKWGVEISKVSITSIALSDVKKLIHEGLTPSSAKLTEIIPSASID